VLPVLSGLMMLTVFSCVSVCLSAMLSNDKYWECQFAINDFEYGNNLHTVASETARSFAPAFNFLSTTLGGAAVERRI